MLICGIDEAGRGPVLGPLVICGVLMPEEKHLSLNSINVKDSKLLTKRQRESISKKLSGIRHKLIIIPPDEIDRYVGKKHTNLNWLEADKSIEILNDLNPDKAFIDCPSPNTKKFTEYIDKKIKNKKTALVCVHHADRDYLVVGAASILAKVTRDAEIEKIKEKIGIDFGSGYLTDPKTVEFLENYWDKYPQLFRHSWEPYKKMVKERFQSDLGEF